MARLLSLESVLTFGFLAALTATQIQNHYSTAIPSGAKVAPLPAAVFNDSVGVNTHLNYPGTAYDTDYAKWSATLLRSPIKHVRDGFCSWGTASTFCTGRWRTRWNQLAAAGVKFDVITNPWEGWTSGTTGCHGTCNDGYLSALGVTPSSIAAYEGPNECDINKSAQCTNVGTTDALPGVQTVVKWAPYYWQLASSNVAIYSAAMAFPQDYSEFGNLSSYMNYCAIHDYTKPLQPESNTLTIGLVVWQAEVPAMCGSNRSAIPIVSTETGYPTGPPYTKYGGESQLAQERYTPRILFFHLEHRVFHVYFYELIDEGAQGSGDTWGLLSENGTPKPAWTRLMQLMSYFKDTRSAPGTPLRYSLTGDTSGVLQQVLFQRSNGTYILVPWLGTQQWDWTTDSDISPTKETLTLTLPSSVKSVTVTKFGDYGARTLTTVSGTNGKFPLPVSSLIEAVSFHT